MKVIGINGSPRKEGNTSILMKTVFKELEQQGIETEMIYLAGRNLRGCIACRKCWETAEPECSIKEDSFNECLAKMLAADGILLGSPVHSSGITSQMQALLERAGIASKGKGVFRHKVGAAVTAVRRAGAVGAFDIMNHFMQNKEMFIVGATYWNMGVGHKIGEVEQDEEGMKNMRSLGQNMAWLLKKIHGVS